MNREKLAEIIIKDIKELNDISEEIRIENQPTNLEIDMAISKAKLVLDELQLLKENFAGKASIIEREPKKNYQEVTNELIENPLPINHDPIPEEQPEREIISEHEIEEEDEPVELEQEPIVETEKQVEEKPDVKAELEIDDEPEAIHEKEDEQIEVEPEEKPIEESKLKADKKMVGENFQTGRSLNDLIGGNGTLDQKIGQSPINSLQTAIGINDRFLFIRELFQNDSDKYAKTVADLDKLDDLKQAADYLSSNMKMKKTETSIKFVELIKRRFAK